MNGSIYAKTQVYQVPIVPYPIGTYRYTKSQPEDCRPLIYSNRLANHILKNIFICKQQTPQETTDSLFENRLDLLRSKLELIILQLAERKTINKKILYQIDQDSCRVQTLYFQMGQKAYVLSGEKISLEKMRFDLERQRRNEQSTYFNDTAFLNRELRDTLIQYMDEVQKNQLMTEEDIP